MPENLTRREFFKDLGMWGTAITAGSMLSIAADSKAPRYERPSWIKEVDDPTVEVEWDQVKRFDYNKTCLAGFAGYVGQDVLDELTQKRAANLANWKAEGRDGYTLRDQAIAGAVRSYPQFGPAALAKFILPGLDDERYQPPNPRWEGTPEENANMVKTAMRFFGAASVGFLELEPDTTRKLIYAVDSDGHRIEFEDVEMAYETEDTRVIPNSARWAIVYTLQMSEETWNRSPTPLGNMTAGMGYDQKIGVQLRMQKFLRALGYQGLGEESSYNATGLAPAMAVMAGLGELSRLNRLITPEYGPVVRVFKIITDLPLAPTKPIDAGIMEFCKSCTKCADMCPPAALSFDDPTWEVRGGWNNPGHKAFFEDSTRCRSYWFQVGTGCSICFSVCPFSKNNLSSFHRLRDRLVATTSVFNPTLKAIDDLLYTPTNKGLAEPTKTAASWWDLDLPEYGYDTSRSVGSV